MPDTIPLRRPGLRGYLASLWSDPTVPFWLRLFCAAVALSVPAFLTLLMISLALAGENPFMQPKRIEFCTKPRIFSAIAIEMFFCICALAAYWIIAFVPPDFRWRKTAIIAASAASWLSTPVSISLYFFFYIFIYKASMLLECTGVHGLHTIIYPLNFFFMWGTLWYFHIQFNIDAKP